jgi:hypothetical protein
LKPSLAGPAGSAGSVSRRPRGIQIVQLNNIVHVTRYWLGAGCWVLAAVRK